MVKRSLGIFLGRTGAEAALIERQRHGAYKVVAQVRAEANNQLWTGDPGELRSLFKQLAKRLPDYARRADVQVQISLPDPLISEDRLGFRDLPDSPAEARDLILWRLARELRKPPESMACAWQAEKIEGDETRVLVRILDRAVLDAVNEAAAASGFFATRIEGWSGYEMNDNGHSEAGALIWANGDWWSLMCWARPKPENPSECETLVHSEWREANENPHTAAEKVSRIVKSFALSSKVDQLPVALDLPEPLAETVRATLSMGDVNLTPEDFPRNHAGGATRVALDAF